MTSDDDSDNLGAIIGGIFGGFGGILLFAFIIIILAKIVSSNI